MLAIMTYMCNGDFFAVLTDVDARVLQNKVLLKSVLVLEFNILHVNATF